MMTERISAFLLAGGQSTRMGRDKALLPFRGRPLAAHAVDLLRSAGWEPRICGSRPDLAKYAEIIPDAAVACGPLAGLAAGLAASTTELNLFLPVDVPLMPVEFLRWMTERARLTGSLATIPVVGGRTQPLCAVYHRELLEGFQSCLSEGRLRIVMAVQETAVSLGTLPDLFVVETAAAALRPEPWIDEKPPCTWFRNINGPGDYALLSGTDVWASGSIIQ